MHQRNNESVDHLLAKKIYVPSTNIRERYQIRAPHLARPVLDVLLGALVLDVLGHLQCPVSAPWHYSRAVSGKTTHGSTPRRKKARPRSMRPAKDSKAEAIENGGRFATAGDERKKGLARAMLAGLEGRSSETRVHADKDDYEQREGIKRNNFYRERHVGTMR